MFYLTATVEKYNFIILLQKWSIKFDGGGLEQPRQGGATGRLSRPLPVSFPFGGPAEGQGQPSVDQIRRGAV